MPNDVTPPAGTPPAGTPPAGTPPAGTPPAGTPAPAWHGFAETDADGTAYVKTKGWAGPQDVIKSYQNAEKLLGRSPDQLLVLPRADDPAGFRATMAKLGMPETPDKYEFSKPDGITPDESYMGWARGTFHKVGLTAGQVKELTAEHNTYVKGVLDKQKSDYNLKVQAEKSELLAEWGAGHERMMAASKHAAQALGFDQDTINAIEQAKGYKATYKFFADLGKKMGEDGLPGSGKGPGFEGQLTPAEAKAQYDAATLDPAFVKALTDGSHPGHKAAVERKTRLFAIMYPN